MYTNVIFHRKTNNLILKAFVEKNELRFNDEGIASLALVEGQQYNLFCFASGNAGSNYELTIIEPKDIVFTISKTLESSREDKSMHAFTISFKEEYSDYIL